MLFVFIVVIKMGDPNKRHDMTAVEIQQGYYEAVGDADWELYEKKDRRYLLQKIAVALCGPPSKEGNLIDCVKGHDSELKLEGYEARDEDTCMKVFEKILEQAKYSHNGENLIISVLRVVCVIPKREIGFFERTPGDYWLDLHTKKGDSVHCLVFHVFSIRKCISMNSKVKGCKLFIDHDARVYETWVDYLTENKLPKCVMVVPQNGEYTGTLNGEMPVVNLTVTASPELGPGAQVLNAVDNISTAANVGALVAVVGSIFATPVVAPVLVGTAVGVATVSGVYSIGRSIGNLVDRAQHEQSIGFESMEARSSWINIMVSTVGISFTTAGKLLTWAATSGRNVKILMSALDFLKFTNLATGFIGCANGLGDMIYKYVKFGETPSATEVFQFTTSALFLGIGVMSNQTAQEIVKDAQANKINEIRDSLSSNNKRRIFDKVTAETRRLKGTIDGNTDVIKALKTIENKDEFFGKIKNLNKSFNKSKVRISLSPDGKVLINNSHTANVNKMYRMGPAARSKLLAKYGPADVTTKNAPTRIYSSDQVPGSSKTPLKDFQLCNIRPEEMIKISAFIINLSVADQNFVLDLLSTFSEVLHDGFLLVCTELIISFLPAESKLMESIDPNWKRRLVFFVFQYLRSQITDDENDSVFMAALKSYIRDGRINRETLLKLKKAAIAHFEKVKNDKESRNKHWDEGDEYIKNYLKGFRTLRVGQELDIGSHKILVKQTTVDYFQKWLENYSQEKCDLFMQLCFKIIETFHKDEVRRLNAINPDEDLLMRVSVFLLGKFDIDTYAVISSTDDKDTVLTFRTEIVNWCKSQRLRTQYTCVSCKGIRYCANK
ncbi:hypothetical protein PYW07_017123 [Mythimna separata]|uniref:DUF4781 domain-containing protein n=1 Tax=Mythimna separata TaxID=271217 RepID=A0AAD8DX74_MYTSE|nr:hypothetical protein PYW07_017123 [Mythimna separata]